MPIKQPDGLYSETIDDIDYEFELWGAERALDVGLELSALIGAPLRHLGAALQGAGGMDAKADWGLLGQAIAALFEGLAANKGAAKHVIVSLSTLGVRAKGVPVKSFDNAYRGRLSHLRKVVMAAGEVQFGDFFEEIRRGMSSLQGMMAASATPLASPGAP